MLHFNRFLEVDRRRGDIKDVKAALYNVSSSWGKQRGRGVSGGANVCKNTSSSSLRVRKKSSPINDELTKDDEELLVRFKEGMIPVLRKIKKRIQEHRKPDSMYFHEGVNTAVLTDYNQVIKEPIDMLKIHYKLIDKVF